MYRRLQPYVPEAAALCIQVAFADRLLLNKTDLVSEEALARIEARLRGINPFAPIQRCTRGTVSVDSVLDVRGFDLQRALQVNPQLLDRDAAPTQHDTSVTSVSLDQGAPRHLRTVQQGELDLELAQVPAPYPNANPNPNPNPSSYPSSNPNPNPNANSEQGSVWDRRAACIDGYTAAHVSPILRY